MESGRQEDLLKGATGPTWPAGAAGVKVPGVRPGRLALAELSRHDWGRFRCGCGESAQHVSEYLKVVVSASGEAELAGIDFSGHLVEEGGLFEVSVPAVSVIIAALAGTVTDFARAELISLLKELVSGDTHGREQEREQRDFGELCRSAARDGIWVLLKHVFGREREDVGNIFLMVDPDESRRRYYAQFAESKRRPRH